MPVDLHEILAPGGPIARRLGEQYEFRPQQLEMALAVETALKEGHHLLMEAGTGVGKSFAYLLPAIDRAISEKKRVIVSTHTISLQEQLIDKDIPLLQAIYPDEFTAVLVKGRTNFLCKRRLENTRSRQGMLFDHPQQLEGLNVIANWAERTRDGSRSDLPAEPEPAIWERVCAEHGNCLGKKCQYYKDCFWQAAKRRMSSGNILIVNHALFFSDLALRMAGINYLPKYDLVILDEAHTVEDVAGQHFGLKISEAAVRYQMRVLYDPKRGKGALSTHGAAANDAIDDIVELETILDGFFDRCIGWHEQHAQGNGRIREPHIVHNDISPKLADLCLHLKAMLPGLKDEEVTELNASIAKVQVLGQTLEAIIGQAMKDAVYWMDVGNRTPRRVSLHAAPIDVAQGLRMELFEKMSSVVMCSATLCTAGTKQTSTAGNAADDPRFAYIRRRLGVAQARTLTVGSPFDYTRQVTLYIEPDLPEPSDTRRFMPAATERILHYLDQTRGGAFVLFTSYRAMTDAANLLVHRLGEMNLPLLVQGHAMPRRQLLDQFRNTPNAVLFGTASFWQGIDVRGDTLRNVIIVKLPFAVPDEPLTEAKLEAVTRGGGNAFMDYSVPEAIIKLKQGFGRLIRSKTDKGIVVLLDSRISSKRYGKLFLDALPACKQVIVRK